MASTFPGTGRSRIALPAARAEATGPILVRMRETLAALWPAAHRPQGLKTTVAARVATEPLAFAQACREVETTRRRWRRVLVYEVLGVAVLGLVACVLRELDTSRGQARYFASVARELRFAIGKGPSDRIRFPRDGPYDMRLGYARMPGFAQVLGRSGFRIEEQARWSDALDASVASGNLFPIYAEKTQAGLTVLGGDGRVVHAARHPRRAYRSFAAVPPLVTASLLFIENRELLDGSRPYLNPAVEWDRFAWAGLSLGWNRLGGDVGDSGGSTLATQLEKLRHSPEGRTATPREKLKQMYTAAMRAYRGGPATLESRREVLVDYINSMPLAAIGGWGEVQGLGDGLEAWFGADFEQLNRLLVDPERDVRERGAAYRQVLALLLAQRRPTHDLVHDRQALGERIERYLPYLAEQGVIPHEVARAASDAPTALRDAAVTSPSNGSGKTALGLRAELQTLLRLDNPYDLERLDLVATTTIDTAAQEAVAATLKGIQEGTGPAAAGLLERRMLASGDPAAVTYSFTLYERGDDANHLRVRTDTHHGAFDLNAGSKLELGSTAKLRTLVTYLECVAELHERLSGLDAEELRLLAVDPRDRLTGWARGVLLREPRPGLETMLRAAMRRVYSASPAERFFTGGGMHTFANFEGKHGGETLTVAEALRDSVNLVFIRLLRDVVEYHINGGGATSHPQEAAPLDPRRYLEESADRESRVFLERFLRAYAPLSREAARERLFGRVAARAPQLACLYLYLQPAADAAELASFLHARLPGVRLPAREIGRLLVTYSGDRLTLPDRGWVTGLHPIEVWMVRHLEAHPGATREELVEASRPVREVSYRWLFETRHASAQQSRIRQLLEEKAFKAIHRRWQRLGYPFPSLVPSYATAIGSSADRPEALAELLGIVLNGGVRKPTTVFESLRFGGGTPFETTFRHRPAGNVPVLRPEIALVVREALVDVVENGTARRLGGGLVLPDGRRVPVGGKTGTGDNRRESYTERGRLVASRAMSRTATFAFFLGDRFFGVLTAYVPGSQADSYSFTSTLPVQVLKRLASDLAPLLAGEAKRFPGGESSGSMVEVARRPPAPAGEATEAAPEAAETLADGALEPVWIQVAAAPGEAGERLLAAPGSATMTRPMESAAADRVDPAASTAGGAPRLGDGLDGDASLGPGSQEAVYALDVVDGLAARGDAPGPADVGWPGIVGGEREREVTVEAVQQVPEVAGASLDALCGVEGISDAE